MKFEVNKGYMENLPLRYQFELLILKHYKSILSLKRICLLSHGLMKKLYM